MEHRTRSDRSGRLPKRGRAPGRGVWVRRLGAAGVLALVAGLLLGWPWLRAQSQVATAYGAKVGCSCHYIDGRNLHDCAKDFEPGMSPVWLSEDAATHTITARYGILSAQKASWSAGPPCVLEPWKD